MPVGLPVFAFDSAGDPGAARAAWKRGWEASQG